MNNLLDFSKLAKTRGISENICGCQAEEEKNKNIVAFTRNSIGLFVAGYENIIEVAKINQKAVFKLHFMLFINYYIGSFKENSLNNLLLPDNKMNSKLFSCLNFLGRLLHGNSFWVVPTIRPSFPDRLFKIIFLVYFRVTSY